MFAVIAIACCIFDDFGVCDCIPPQGSREFHEDQGHTLMKNPQSLKKYCEFHSEISKSSFAMMRGK